MTELCYIISYETGYHVSGYLEMLNGYQLYNFIIDGNALKVITMKDIKYVYSDNFIQLLGECIVYVKDFKRQY